MKRKIIRAILFPISQCFLCAGMILLIFGDVKMHTLFDNMIKDITSNCGADAINIVGLIYLALWVITVPFDYEINIGGPNDL